jgi:hypothetical protein
VLPVKFSSTVLGAEEEASGTTDSDCEIPVEISEGICVSGAAVVGLKGRDDEKLLVWRLPVLFLPFLFLLLLFLVGTLVLVMPDLQVLVASATEDAPDTGTMEAFDSVEILDKTCCLSIKEDEAPIPTLEQAAELSALTLRIVALLSLKDLRGCPCL